MGGFEDIDVEHEAADVDDDGDVDEEQEGADVDGDEETVEDGAWFQGSPLSMPAIAATAAVMATAAAASSLDISLGICLGARTDSGEDAAVTLECWVSPVAAVGVGGGLASSSKGEKCLPPPRSGGPR